MAGFQYTNLRLGNIEEGQFLASADEDMAKAGEALARMIRRYGKEAAKARAGLTIDVAITLCSDVEHMDMDDPLFVVEAKCKVKLPQRPVSGTTARMVERDRWPVLATRASGSSPVDPRQGQLFTIDGEAIDPATGELLTDDEARTDLKHG